MKSKHFFKQTVLFLSCFILSQYKISYAQSIENKSLTVGLTIKGLVDIVDHQMNNDKFFDNSLVEQEKEIRFSKLIENVKITGSSFKGSSFSGPFFSYQDHIFIEGTFNDDKTMIKAIEVTYVYNQFSGDHKLSYSTESKFIKFKAYNVSADRTKNYYSTFSSSNAKLLLEQYYTDYFVARTHRRFETYSESVVKVLDQLFKPNVSITFGKPTVEPKTPLVKVRVKVSDEAQNVKERGLSSGYGGLVYAHLSRIENLEIYEGVKVAAITNEIELIESGLLEDENNINEEIARESLNKPVDLEISISSKISYDDDDNIESFYVFYNFSFDGTNRNHMYRVHVKNSDPVLRTLNWMRNDELLKMIIGHCIRSIRLKKE